MQLKAKRKRKYYKSDATYIRAVYNNNKKKIKENISEEWLELFNGNTYEAFKSLVRDQMAYQNPKTKKKYTVEEAIRREARSKDLNKNLTTGDIYARNFHNLITKATEIKELFYQHEGIKRIDFKQYRFLGYYAYNSKEAAVYNYGDSYFLEFQSPKDGNGKSLMYLSGYQWSYTEKNNIKPFEHVYKKGRRK